MSHAERRNDQRVSVSLPVTYQLLGAPTRSPYTGRVVDISAGGLRLICDRPVELGERVDVAVNLPARTIPYQLPGRVVWVKPASSGSECGVQFLDLSPDQRYELDEIVQFLMRPGANA